MTYFLGNTHITLSSRDWQLMLGLEQRYSTTLGEPRVPAIE